jgi:hypothetical protein
VRASDPGQVWERRRAAAAGWTAIRFGVDAADPLQLLLARREDERLATQMAGDVSIAIGHELHMIIGKA